MRECVTVIARGLCGLLLAATSLHAAQPCTISIVEQGTGWPVPLVELKTVHGACFVSDNAGLIAFDLPECMGRETWLHVRGFGYGVQRDGLGYEGVRLTPQPGGQHRIEVSRHIVAKRLGRITGVGIFAESQKLGAELDWPESGVVGCDSVQQATWDGHLFWLWGDTSLARHPLGIFAGTAARTPIQPLARLTPPIRLHLDYFRDAKGGPRPIAPFAGPGPTWLTGLTTVPDHGGKDHLACTFVKITPPLTPWRTGLCTWDEHAGRFTELKTLWERTDDSPHGPAMPEGHAVRWIDGMGDVWLLFGNPFPQLRCPATFEAWQTSSSWEKLEPPQFLRSPDGRRVEPHSGSIAWNPWRRSWVVVFMEKFGKPSPFGELWYAEAEGPLGPWSTAVKIVSNANYTLYNPRIHPGFDAADSPALLFEATFTKQFADSPPPVARYDYNQLLFRLDLNDQRLAPARVRPHR